MAHQARSRRACWSGSSATRAGQVDIGRAEDRPVSGEGDAAAQPHFLDVLQILDARRDIAVQPQITDLDMLRFVPIVASISLRRTARLSLSTRNRCVIARKSL